MYVPWLELSTPSEKAAGGLATHKEIVEISNREVGKETEWMVRTQEC